MSEDNRKEIFSLLALSRRAGVLQIGQDAAKMMLRRGERAVLFIAEDCSANVLRMFKGYEERGQCRIVDFPAKREDMMTFLGVATQIVALPERHGLTLKIESLLRGKGGRLHE